jgi:hypothetical protein
LGVPANSIPKPDRAPPRKRWPIMSEELMDALVQAGVIPVTDDGPSIRRVVIIAEAGNIPSMYVEYVGDSTWLELAGMLPPGMLASLSGT